MVTSPVMVKGNGVNLPPDAQTPRAPIMLKGTVNSPPDAAGLMRPAASYEYQPAVTPMGPKGGVQPLFISMPDMPLRKRNDDRIDIDQVMGLSGAHGLGDEYQPAKVPMGPKGGVQPVLVNIPGGKYSDKVVDMPLMKRNDDRIDMDQVMGLSGAPGLGDEYQPAMGPMGPKGGVQFIPNTGGAKYSAEVVDKVGDMTLMKRSEDPINIDLAHFRDQVSGLCEDDLCLALGYPENICSHLEIMNKKFSDKFDSAMTSMGWCKPEETQWVSWCKPEEEQCSVSSCVINPEPYSDVPDQKQVDIHELLQGVYQRLAVLEGGGFPAKGLEVLEGGGVAAKSTGSGQPDEPVSPTSLSPTSP